MKTTHHLKTWPDYFRAIGAGTKTFELRKNDRNFQVGDVLELQEYELYDYKYTGATLSLEVTYILEGGELFGLAEGYCIMSIKPIT